MTLTQIKPAGLSKPVDLADNEQIRLGTGNDLLIYHNGFTSIIGSTSHTLGFYSGVNHHFLNADGTETLAKFTPNGSAELYYDNSKKLETTTAGVTVTGGIDATGLSTFSASGSAVRLNDGSIQRYGNADADYFQYYDGSGNIAYLSVGSSRTLRITTDDFRVFSANNTEQIIRGQKDGAVELYYDNVKKFETASHGNTLSGDQQNLLGVVKFDNTTNSGMDMRWEPSSNSLDFVDTVKARFGTGNDLQIYHDGSNGNSHINESGSGSLVIKATNTYINNSADEQMIAAIADGAVELYHDNVKKFETISDGVQVNGDFKIDNPVNAGDDIFFDASENWMRWDDNVKIQCGNSGDLEIYHDGTSNYIKSISGILKLISPSNTNTEIIVDSDEIAINCIADGAVELYHNDSKKFETTSAGATLTGHLNIAAGNVEFASGNGIDFSAVSDGSRSVSTDGNKLDDYEEGTWTPSLHFGGNTTGITYNNREGSYTKIGRQVTLNWMIDLSSKGSATGDARIYAMPFATANLLTTTSVEANGISAYWNNFEPDLYYMAFFADHAYISIRSQDGNGLSDALNEMTNSDFANNSTFRGTITYFAAT